MRKYNDETDYEIVRRAVLDDPDGAALTPTVKALRAAGIEAEFRNVPGTTDIDRAVLRAMAERRAIRERRLG